jgi:hypothetical protein
MVKCTEKGKERAFLSPFASPATSSKPYLYHSSSSSMDVDVADCMSPCSSPDVRSGPRRRDCAGALLEAFDTSASAQLRGHPQDSLILCLQECFDATLSHFRNNSIPLEGLCSAMGTPSVEQALCAFGSIMSNGDVPNPLQLISLAFFGLSLICLSLEDDALEGALSALHLNARSWATSLGHVYQRDFEDLVDDLWLPSGRSRLRQHLRDHTFAAGVETESVQPMWWWADDFILQLAERFIACKHPQSPHVTIY